MLLSTKVNMLGFLTFFSTSILMICGIAWTDNIDNVFVYKSYKDALSALSYYKSIKGFEEACVFKLDGFSK